LDEIIIPKVPSVQGNFSEKELEFIPKKEIESFPKKEIELKHEVIHEKREFEKPLKHEENDKEFEPIHKMIRITCLIALFTWFVLIVLLSLITYSNPFYTLIGLSPVMLTIIVTYILVDKYHLEHGFLLVFPFIFTGLFFMLGMSGRFSGLDYLTLSTVNIIFGMIFVIVITTHYASMKNKDRKTNVKANEEISKETKQIKISLDNDEGVKEFVSSIEDKSKAINAVIGRVYSIRRGGSEHLRKKIRIDSAHYNEFNELQDKDPEEKKRIAIRLVKKIQLALEILSEKEKNVFDKEDFTGMFNLNRDPEGNDSVLQILIKNDKDPVKAYYEGAVDFCKNALKELEKE